MIVLITEKFLRSFMEYNFQKDTLEILRFLDFCGELFFKRSRSRQRNNPKRAIIASD